MFRNPVDSFNDFSFPLVPEPDYSGFTSYHPQLFSIPDELEIQLQFPCDFATRLKAYFIIKRNLGEEYYYAKFICHKPYYVCDDLGIFAYYENNRWYQARCGPRLVATSVAKHSATIHLLGESGVVKYNIPEDAFMKVRYLVEQAISQGLDWDCKSLKSDSTKLASHLLWLGSLLELGHTVLCWEEPSALRPLKSRHAGLPKGIVLKALPLLASVSKKFAHVWTLYKQYKPCIWTDDYDQITGVTLNVSGKFKVYGDFSRHVLGEDSFRHRKFSLGVITDAERIGVKRRTTPIVPSVIQNDVTVYPEIQITSEEKAIAFLKPFFGHTQFDMPRTTSSGVKLVSEIQNQSGKPKSCVGISSIVESYDEPPMLTYEQLMSLFRDDEFHTSASFEEAVSKMSYDQIMDVLMFYPSDCHSLNGKLLTQSQLDCLLTYCHPHNQAGPLVQIDETQPMTFKTSFGEIKHSEIKNQGLFGTTVAESIKHIEEEDVVKIFNAASNRFDKFEEQDPSYIHYIKTKVMDYCADSAKQYISQSISDKVSGIATFFTDFVAKMKELWSSMLQMFGDGTESLTNKLSVGFVAMIAILTNLWDKAEEYLENFRSWFTPEVEKPPVVNQAYNTAVTTVVNMSLSVLASMTSGRFTAASIIGGSILAYSRTDKLSDFLVQNAKKLFNSVYYVFTNDKYFDQYDKFSEIKECTTRLNELIELFEKDIHENAVTTADVYELIETHGKVMKYYKELLNSRAPIEERRMIAEIMRHADESVSKAKKFQAILNKRCRPVVIYLQGPANQGKSLVSTNLPITVFRMLQKLY